MPTDELAALMDEQARLTERLDQVRSRMAELFPLPIYPPYRIALRPDDHRADPMDHATLCDDIVVNRVPMFRAEQMSHKSWWVCCYLDDDTHDRICWSVRARKNPLRLEWRTTEYPTQYTVYEGQASPSPTQGGE